MTRPKPTLFLGLAGSLVFVVGGCATAPRDAGFGDVSQAVADRTGHRVRWNTGSADDASAAVAVGELLGRELSADDAVQVALLNNQRLQAAYESLGVAQADLVQAGLLRNPIFDAEVKFAEGGDGHVLELAVVQEFLDVFQIPLRRRVAARALESAKLSTTGAVLDLAGQVRSAFYAHQAATQTLELRQSVAAAAAAGYDFARRLHGAGNITDLQLAQEQALHEQARVDVRGAEAEVLATRERLNRLMGLWGPDAARWSVAGRLPEVPADELDVAGIESRAVERSLELAVARTAVESTASSLGIRRSLAPFGGGDVELGAAGEREHDGAWSVGPAFAVPLPLFDTGAAGVSRAGAELRRARRDYAATAVEVRAAARAARDRLAAARDRAEHYRAVILPLRQRILEQTQAENNAMLVGTFTLIRAKQDQIEAGTAYVAALRDYWLARAQLEQVVNGRALGAQDAAAPSGGFTPAGASRAGGGDAH